MGNKVLKKLKEDTFQVEIAFDLALVHPNDLGLAAGVYYQLKVERMVLLARDH